jgi:uncharacterized protein DUF935
VGLLQRARAALLAVSAYQPPPSSALDLSSPEIISARRQYGGQISQPTHSQSRWFMSDLWAAEHNADGGNLQQAGRLMAFARTDGIFAGVLSTRTGGLVRLPKRFRGDKDVLEAFEPGHDSVRSVFDEMHPPSELALLAGDGELLGVGVGEFVPVQGRKHPVLVRLDPQYLSYMWSENRWYYQAVEGRLAITPGDGRWFLHMPGGRVAPWQSALWRAIGKNVIRKDHANQHKDNWEAKLANPARVAIAPQGSSEPQKDSFFKQIMAWGVNTVFSLTPGYDVKLLESNGRGYEAFEKTIADANTEMIISIAGQTVTVDGGAGFQNSDIHKTIRADLIKATADGLAFTINTQGIPSFIALMWGEDAIETKRCVMEWDVTPPKDRNSEASSMVTVGNAITTLGEALQTRGIDLDVPTLCERFAVPTLASQIGDDDAAASGKPGLRLIKGGADDTTIAPVITGDKQAEDTALNGAQVASLLQIVQEVAAGSIPRDAGLGIIKRAFLVDDIGAAELMGSVGKGFVPTTETPAPNAAPAAPEVVAA